uniref:RING-type domain-containing protein n=1 Tax=Heliothis virescens TaxID=7102 RepID=A0A2A4JRU3_HELVI
MSEQVEVKPDALPDLDDLLQCPVCYEIPSGQIFQCNEGHHVCGRCKMRLDVCPVCRALFFGTRNYAMEELIANVKKLRAFKLGGKVTTDTCSENNTPPKEDTTEVPENESVGDDVSEQSSQTTQRPPQACKGLFRCLSCKNGNGVRLPAARLLNHLRYFHSPELIEGRSENGEYVQAWQFSTVPGRIVTAVRVADMGIFFLIIEISNDNVCAWLSMAASPWVAHEFSYTVTISGNDREAIFSDCVWSVRSCEGSLKKRGHCLVVSGLDARALIAPASISGKLSVRRTPPDQLTNQTQPRAVLRVANRVNNRDNSHTHAHDLEPFLQDLQNDVARLSRAFATLGREANALVRSEAEMRARIENRHNTGANERTSTSSDGESPPTIENLQDGNNAERTQPSRSARRRMRQRLRAALNATQPPVPAPRIMNGPPRPNGPIHSNNMQRHFMTGLVVVQQPPVPPPVAPPPVPPPVAPQTSSGMSNQNGNGRQNKKKRRQRR